MQCNDTSLSDGAALGREAPWHRFEASQSGGVPPHSKAFGLIFGKDELPDSCTELDLPADRLRLTLKRDP